MNKGKVDLITFVSGKSGPSAGERLMAGGRLAIAQDLVELALECPLIDQVIVATESGELAARLAGHERVIVEPDHAHKPFHFGERLAEIVETHGIRRPLYFGGAGAPLLAPESLDELCADLLASDRVVIANNIWSADFFGFSPPEALRRVDLPASQDNNLPFLLSRQGGLRAVQLERAIENLFDVDTPTDLAILKLQAAAKPQARAFLQAAPLDTERLEALMPLLISARSQITLIGRVKTELWDPASSDIPGPKRLYVEERGMKASGRETRGEVRSLLGHLFEVVGSQRFFAYLAGFSSAVFFDTRVLFEHLRLSLSDKDRFSSDLGDPASIDNETARGFTAAALDCGVPVIMGGRNIVSGGLWALTQEAWNRADAGLIVPE